MKYVMFEQEITKSVSRYVPVIFPDTLAHAEIAEKLLPTIDKGRIASAGDIDMENLKCSGHSVSLKIDSAGDFDSAIMQHYDILHGLVY